ncbi:hypothetical protein DLAC_11545 [Tieghemostelium lacteum]|uniref:Uncharacterized protein n=1 Tax=Tieghemostelium lacteum TaxID=361077 RepID=A0A152A1U1_TIELA|nr:hypothetical protein DLAC_11545 [Tieghemostelium lacteum]|eukprot:KYR00087.1 hypothetical protein DLAC_11545 [Tieghemostelium lacteum]
MTVLDAECKKHVIENDQNLVDKYKEMIEKLEIEEKENTEKVLKLKSQVSNLNNNTNSSISSGRILKLNDGTSTNTNNSKTNFNNNNQTQQPKKITIGNTGLSLKLKPLSLQKPYKSNHNTIELANVGSNDKKQQPNIQKSFIR